MIRIEIKHGEPIDKALRRLKKICQKENLIGEVRRNGSYEKPSDANRRERLRRIRNRQRMQKRAMYGGSTIETPAPRSRY